MSKLTEERFLKEVANHEMAVLHEDGVYRHIQFKRPGESCMHFDLVTYPGHLCYSGDMGCYVFSRIHDMFQFFKKDMHSIDFRYWAEKIEAGDKRSADNGAVEFDEGKFVKVINEYRTNWLRKMKADGRNKEERRDFWDAVEDDVINADSDSGGHRKQIAAHDFYHTASEFYFADLGEHSVTSYTHSFLWCCYAIAWGVKKYDEAKQKIAEPATTE